MCLANVLRNTARAGVTAKVGGVSAADVAAAAAAAAAKQQSSSGRGSTSPGVLLTTMPLAQQCFGRADGKAFLCPIEDVRMLRPGPCCAGDGAGPGSDCKRHSTASWLPQLAVNRPCATAMQAPCMPDGAPALSLDGCFVSLPLAELGVWHMVRRPLDVVVSALWFHQQEPAPEAWIDAEVGKSAATQAGQERCAEWPACPTLPACLGLSARWTALPLERRLADPKPVLPGIASPPLAIPCTAALQFGTRLGMMKKAGVPAAALEGLGLGKQHETVPYGQLLRRLPEEKALLVEFWRSLPGGHAAKLVCAFQFV